MLAHCPSAFGLALGIFPIDIAIQAETIYIFRNVLGNVACGCTFRVVYAFLFVSMLCRTGFIAILAHGVIFYDAANLLDVFLWHEEQQMPVRCSVVLRFGKGEENIYAKTSGFRIGLRSGKPSWFLYANAEMIDAGRLWTKSHYCRYRAAFHGAHLRGRP